jgi:hypothetical protein
MKHTLIIALMLTLVANGNGQTNVRKLSNTINHPAINVSAPYISLDGNSMVFVSDYGEDDALILNYATKKDPVNWNDPMVIPKNINTRLTYLWGFALSEDGKTLLLTSLKGGGLGGYDIHISELQGTTWTEPRNPGLPLNSNLNDGAPSMTADGHTMYFMRCEEMDRFEAKQCKIMVATKNYMGKWEEPVELPSQVNTGNSQTPRILGDGETLIFASDQFPGGKGGMDLYQTRLEGVTWTQPLALNFANTEKDDQFVSTSSLGRYLLKEVQGPRKSEIAELLFPPDLKPKSTMKIEGIVSSPAGAPGSFITVYNQTNQKRVFNGRPAANGSFTIYLTEGSYYDLSIEPEKDNLSYYSKSYDLRGDKFQIADKIEAQIKPISAGDEFELTGLTFKPYSTEVTKESGEELRRMSRLINGNPGRNFVIDVTLKGYLEDSIQSDADLTEMIIDSTYIQILKEVPDSLVAESMEVDSLDLDSLALDTIPRDTMITMIVDSLVVEYTFHNNRTAQQADAIIGALVTAGVPRNKLTSSYRAIPEAVPEERRIRATLKVR